MLRVEEKQTCTVFTKYFTDMGTETASYEVLALGNNIYSMDSLCASLSASPANPSDPLT
jgi:hypothetical protein